MTAEDPGSVPLRRAARVAAVLGAAGSVGCMLRVGYRNGSTVPPLLLVLFLFWVLSPFVALVLADVATKSRPLLAPGALRRVTLAVALGSLAVYAYAAWSPPRPQPAAMFLVVPFASWLFLAIVVSITALRRGARRR